MYLKIADPMDRPWSAAMPIAALLARDYSRALVVRRQNAA